MRKIFLAGPFKSMVNEEKRWKDNKAKDELNDLINHLTERGNLVHNAHKREEWGKKFMTPDECTKIDYEKIAECDLFIAFPGTPASPGTHIEMGWASAMKKQVILLLKKGIEYAYLVQGLHMVTDVQVIYYEEPEDYIRQLDEILE